MWRYFLIVVFLNNVESIIRTMNDTEYDLMPALFELDDYESCLAGGGTYCLATFDLVAEPDNHLIQIIHEYSALTQKHYNHSYIERGICVSECEAAAGVGVGVREMGAVLEQCASARERGQRGLETRVVRVHSCDSRAALAAPARTTADWMVAALMLLILALNITATLYDLVHREVKDKKILLCFSISKNWNQLTNGQEEEFKCFNGLRCICTFLVILGHVVIFVGANFISNPHDFEKSYDNTSYQRMLHGLAIVNIHYLLSGFLLVKTLRSDQERGVPVTMKSLPMRMLKRWLRLVPACAVVIAFTATWLRFLGSGPLWNLMVTDNTVKYCQIYWWHHILLINNYIPENKYCAIHTWYIAADTQLFVVCMTVYVATLSRPTLRNFALGLLLLMSMVAPALHVWLQNLDGMLIMNPESFRNLLLHNDTYHYIHVLGHNNGSCFILGIILAQLFYKWKKQGLNLSKKQTKILSYTNWVVLLVLVIVYQNGFAFYILEEQDSVVVRMAFAALYRVAFGLIITFILFSTLSRPKDNFRAMFEWDIWTIPSRLSYSVYLVHYNLLHVIAGLKREVSYFSIFDVLMMYPGVIVISYAVATPFYLMVEAPINSLIKQVLNQKKKL